MRYRLLYEATASYHVTVQADDVGRAKEIADQSAPVLCRKCEGWLNPPGIDLGEWKLKSAVPGWERPDE